MPQCSDVDLKKVFLMEKRISIRLTSLLRRLKMNNALEESKYLKRFQALNKVPTWEGREEADYVPPMTLKGDMILVERLPKIEMKTKSGIIIADAKTYKETAHD